jgi:hypothetical protein
LIPLLFEPFRPGKFDRLVEDFPRRPDAHELEDLREHLDGQIPAVPLMAWFLLEPGFFRQVVQEDGYAADGELA